MVASLIGGIPLWCVVLIYFKGNACLQPKPASPATFGNSHRNQEDLIILGVEWTVTDEELRSHFEQFGEVAHCEVSVWGGGASLTQYTKTWWGKCAVNISSVGYFSHFLPNLYYTSNAFSVFIK